MTVRKMPPALSRTDRRAIEDAWIWFARNVAGPGRVFSLGYHPPEGYSEFEPWASEPWFCTLIEGGTWNTGATFQQAFEKAKRQLEDKTK